MADDNKDQKKEESKDQKPDLAAQNAELTKKIAEYDAKIAKYEALNKKDAEDPDLKEKARLQNEADTKKADETKALENALKFSLKSDEFLKTNASLLPKEIGDIFKQSEKENYGSAIEKVSAIKAGIVQSFFSVQANVDLLTPGLKSSLDDYLKLTKTGKQEKASTIYDGIFEPAFEMLKRVKKAEVINRGYGDESDFEVAYQAKMTKLSKETHLGERSK